MSKRPKSKIPLSVVGISQHGQLSEIERKIHGLTTPREENPHINLKYFDKNFECFGAWQTEELKAFSGFIEKFNQTNWTDICKSSGKAGNKSGFGMTYHKDRKKLPLTTILDEISPDIKFFELRVNQKARVHGFRSVSSFFLVWLDRNHKIYPQ